MNLSTINFSELSNYNDSNSIVCTALSLTENDVESFINFFNKSGLAPEGKYVTGIYRILGNVLGNKGRTDWLVTFDNEDTPFNFMVRLRMGNWIKWTSDFIDNFASDYN